MRDQELFNLARIKAAQDEAAAWQASRPPVQPDPESPEYAAVAATLAFNDMRSGFDGTYPIPPGPRAAGYKAPPPPSGKD